MHELSIPERIETIRREENQWTGMEGNLPQLGPTDRTKHHGVCDRRKEDSLPIKVDGEDDHAKELTDGMEQYYVAASGDTASPSTRIDGPNVPSE